MPYFPPPTVVSRLKPGADRVRTSTLANGDALLEYPSPDVRTFFDVMQRGRQAAKGGPCLGYRLGPELGYAWIRYDEVFDYALSLGGALLALCADSDKKAKIGIYGLNSPEWMLTHFASVANTMISVPLYHTFDAKAIKFILNQTGMKIVFCDNEQRLMHIAELCEKTENGPGLQENANVGSDCINVECLVLMKFNAHFSEEARRNMKKYPHVKFVTFDELVEEGRRAPRPFRKPASGDVYMICYTSGTTGEPKGVVLTHKNLMSSLATMTKIFDTSVKFYTDDCLISYLPLAHIYEQLLETNCFYFGAQIGFFGGDVRKLMDDVKALQPTIFPIVPRLLNRLVSKIQTSVQESGRIKRALFKFTTKRKRASVERGYLDANTIWDKFVFKKIHQTLGGRVRFMTTASAPVSSEVLTFARTVLGCVIFEAYGQTETCGAATCSLIGDFTPGHVGAPIPSCHIKLVDVPELGYLASKDQGEVCVKGPPVTSGYYKEPQKTAELLDADGWLHTGDIGCWTATGALKLIDRRKQMFKLAQGEYVAPEKIENVYALCPLIAQVYVDGSGLQSHLVAVVVPEKEELEKWAHTQSLKEDFVALCSNAQVKAHILKEMCQVGKKNGLVGYEQVKAIYLCPEAFTPENGLLTPTMKSKRPELRKRFQKTIDQLYAESQEAI